MAQPEYTILNTCGTWRIAWSDGERVQSQPVEVPDPQDAPALAQAIATALRQAGYSGQGVCLALPAGRFYWAAIATEGLPKRGTRQAMLYRLEEQLPVDAESLAADFVRHNGSALGLAIVGQEVQPLLTALDAQGVSVAALAPRTWLALQEAYSREPAGQSFAALMAADGQVEFWALTPEGPLVGDRFGLDGQRSLQALRAAELLGAATGTLWLDPALPSSLRQAAKDNWPGPVALWEGTNTDELAAAVAAEHLAGRRPAWVNLRQGLLAAPRPWARLRRPLMAAAILLLAVLAVATAGLLWRAHRYTLASDDARQQQAKVFGALHPGQVVPGDVKRRLLSEWRVSSGLRGLSREVPQEAAALDTLYELVGHLPPQQRLRLLEIRLDGQALYIEGEARSHAEAEAVAMALRQGGALEIAPPKTDQLPSGGVSFVLSGRPLAGAAPALPIVGKGGLP